VFPGLLSNPGTYLLIVAAALAFDVLDSGGGFGLLSLLKLWFLACSFFFYLSLEAFLIWEYVCNAGDWGLTGCDPFLFSKWVASLEMLPCVL